MKNEGMANAMGRIDPELIEEAGSFKAEGKRSVRRLRPYIAAAAVLAACSVILTVFWRPAGGEIALTLYGEELSASPVEVDAPTAAAYARTSVTTVTVPLYMESGVPVEAEVSGGVLGFWSETAGGSGTELEISGPAKLLWTVTDAVPDSQYTLRLGGTRVILSYSDENGSWTVYKK